MTDFANAFLLVYAGLFPILNPIGSAPIFLGLTSSCTEGERNALARRVAINSVLLLTGSIFIGSHLLVFFGITLPVVRIAGGLVLIAFGWKLLHNGRRT
jgi:multiple antibiotic resistance protein